MGDKKKVLISTLYSLEPIVPSIHKFSPQKLILLTSDDQDSKLKESLKDIKKMFSTVMEIKEINAKPYDIYEAAKKTVSLIDNEKDCEIYINITGGRKTLMLGVIYGAYARSDLVTKIIYCTEEKGEFIELPKMPYELNEMERELLELINKKGKINVQETADNLQKTRGLLYIYLKKLKHMGLIDDNFEITQAGKIALL